MLSQLLEKIRGRDTDTDDPTRTTALAAATLLFEVAWADHEISDTELQVLRRGMNAIFDIDPASLESIIVESRQHHDESVGVQSFTRTINDSWDEPRRFELVVMLWKVAYIDAQIDPLEEHTIRRIADLLYLSHARFIQAKFEARDPAQDTAD